MALFKLFRKKSKNFQSDRTLRTLLDSILDKIDAIKGSVELEKIYCLIGDELTKINVSSLFAFYDTANQIIYWRHCQAAKNLTNTFAKLFPENITKQKIPLASLPSYQKAIETKKSLFHSDHLQELASQLNKTGINKLHRTQINSIIAPLVLKNEVIGIWEVLSPDLRQSKINLWENFAQNLTKTLAYTILFQEIKISEEKYRRLIENAIDGVAIINNQGIITFINKALIEILGFQPGEIIGTNFIKFVHPAERHQVQNLYQKRMAGKDLPVLNELRIIDKNEKLKYLQYSASLIKEGGKIIGAQVFARDITENKKLHDTIEQAKNHYEQVIDAIQDGLCVINRNYQIISFNKIFAQKVDISLADLKGKNYREVVPRYDKRVLRHFCSEPPHKNCIIDQAFATGQPKDEIYESTNTKGEKKFYRISVFPAQDDDGQTKQAVILIRDITDTKMAEEEIRRLSEFNQRILDTAPISIAVLNRQGEIIAVNGLAKKLLDRPNKPALGTKLTETKEIVENKHLQKLYQRLLAQGKAFYYNNLSYVSSATKEQKFLNIIAVPLFAKNKKIEGALSMAIDNTEAVLAKQKLEDLNRNLERKVETRTGELEILNKKLNQALELKSKFIADASHELRTPLTVIQGNLDLAIKEVENIKGEIPEIYQLIISEVERMRAILTDLTMLTNADENSEQFLYEKVNLGQLIKAVGQSLKILADQKKIALIYRQGARKVIIWGDEAKLEKLLLNIVRNAIKYTDPKGRVKIWVEKNADEACVVVEDNGIGIPQKDLPFIFERFYRVDKSRSGTEGSTGIGLSIAEWIAEAHGGKITAASKFGKGSKFTVHLPYNYRTLTQQN